MSYATMKTTGQPVALDGNDRPLDTRIRQQDILIHGQTAEARRQHEEYLRYQRESLAQTQAHNDQIRKQMEDQQQQEEKRRRQAAIAVTASTSASRSRSKPTSAEDMVIGLFFLVAFVGGIGALLYFGTLRGWSDYQSSHPYWLWGSAGGVGLGVSLMLISGFMCFFNPKGEKELSAHAQNRVAVFGYGGLSLLLTLLVSVGYVLFVSLAGTYTIVQSWSR